MSMYTTAKIFTALRRGVKENEPTVKSTSSREFRTDDDRVRPIPPTSSVSKVKVAEDTISLRYSKLTDIPQSTLSLHTLVSLNLRYSIRCYFIHRVLSTYTFRHFLLVATTN
ncbi:hypothetical protein BKA69DRAFT_801902 [Paraphysoderma sedebokerense]|nr:hypothetical protein BKA69DRAFT_801902 [Paraphysoderma sedebokerense]